MVPRRPLDKGKSSKAKRPANMLPQSLHEHDDSIVERAPVVNRNDALNEELQPSRTHLSEPEAISSESNKDVIGNSFLLGTCEFLHKHIAQLKSNKHKWEDNLHEFEDELWIQREWLARLRSALLLEWLDNRCSETMREAVYGGNIKLDIHLFWVLKEEPSILEELERAFLKGYQLSGKENVRDIEAAPDVIIEALNRRPTIAIFGIWQKLGRKASRDRILFLIQQIVEAWQSSLNTGVKFDEGGQIAEKWKEALQLISEAKESA